MKAGLNAAARFALSSVLDLFVPAVCPLCGEGEPETGSGFCPDCEAGIVYLKSPLCPVCSLPFEGEGPSHPCSLCAKRPPAFSATVAAAVFDQTARKAVTDLKYGNNLTLINPLKELFWRALREGFGPEPGFSMAVPVPCHRETLVGRGFDLPALLAKRAAKGYGIPWRPRLLVKTRAKVRMAGMRLKGRRQAVSGLYRASGKAYGRVLLVDDVVTSTSTIRAAARQLLKAGAEEVCVAALARTRMAPRRTLG